MTPAPPTNPEALREALIAFAEKYELRTSTSTDREMTVDALMSDFFGPLLAEHDAALAERDEARQEVKEWRTKARNSGRSAAALRAAGAEGALRKATAQDERTAGELAAAEAEKVRLKAQVAILLKVIDAGIAETMFALADEAEHLSTWTSRRLRLENIDCALKGVGDIEARKALGLLVETIDGEVTRAALTEEPPHAE